MSADRNLLFGIVALQMDFVSRDALIAGMHAWVLEKQTPLAEILQRQGALSAEERALLEPLVAKHLQKHGDDPDQSLAALSSMDSARHALAQIQDADVQATLHAVTRAEGKGDLQATVDQSLGKVGNRFRILRNHAEGGLGRVFVAHDEELHREVALKEIKPERADEPDCRARFVLEAEITGGLEHPGIVPVYGLGSYADGRPFYAMRFIRGDSLKEAIGRYHAQAARASRGILAPIALRQLLGRYIDVCQAMAYAHSRGVLHRDLKPSNIMLGKYGETLVVDWGLAKAQGQATHDRTLSELPLTPSLGSDVAATVAGQVLGTLAYMSPEQARGELDRLGPASDVYSLGATLYHVLTGKAPLESKQKDEALRQVQRGEFTPPRLVTPSAPQALEAICLKAMALRPEERYSSAQELAEEIEHWLADEPVTAYRASLAERLGRWARRHRTLVTAAAVLLATVALGLGAGLGAVRVEQKETAHQRDIAESNFKLARQAVDDCFLIAKDQPLLQQEQMKEVKKLLLEKALPYYEGFERAKSDDPDLRATQADNYFKVGYITEEIGNKDAALTAYEKALVLYGELAAANPSVIAFERELASTYNNLGNVQRATGRVRKAEDSYQQARQIRERLAAANPSVSAFQRELASTYNNLGVLHGATGQTGEAERSHQQARQIREKLAAANPGVSAFQRELASTHNNLGVLQRATGRVREAEASFQQARQIQEELVATNLGVSSFQSELASTYYNLSNLQRATGRVREAIDSFQQARQIFEKLVAANPSVQEYQLRLAGTCCNLGLLLRDSGQAQTSLPLFDQARSLLQSILHRSPADVEARTFLRNTHGSRAEALGQLGRQAESIADWDKAVELSSPAERTSICLDRALALLQAGQVAKAIADAEAMTKAEVTEAGDCYNLARIFGIASAALKTTDAPQTEKHAVRAVELLKQAEAKGFFKDKRNIDHLKKDTDLDPLRQRKDFQDWLKHLDAASAGSK